MKPDEIRREAELAAKANDLTRLVALAKEYTRYLSPMFNLIPWDEQVLVAKDRFRSIFSFVASSTAGFSEVSVARLGELMVERPESLVVLRTIAGYRAQELAYIVERQLGVKVTADAIRRFESGRPCTTKKQQKALSAIAEAIHLAIEGKALPRPASLNGFIDRREKFDTANGWEDVAKCFREGVSYTAALYERYLGRPFAYAVDALSGRKADLLEKPVESLLMSQGIPHHRSKSMERIPGFEQAPDFLMPSRDAPDVVIEAKLAEDGGTARDKASRIERLSKTTDARGIVLIAVVDGKGFLRINDVLAPILRVTKGLTFTLSTLGELVDVPAVARHRAR